jgi:hypothetical protein
MRDHLGSIADRREIVRAVPFLEQRDVGEQLPLRRTINGETKVVDARAQRIGHAERCRLSVGNCLKPRLRCTRSRATAAGVTPEMRAACPSVSGRY